MERLTLRSSETSHKTAYEGQTYMVGEKIYYYTGEEWVQADCPPNIQGKSLVLREGKCILE